jgi:hypothetical protein
MFDFSAGALDKYLMYSILPLSIICGATFSNILDNFESKRLKEIVRPMMVGLIIGAVLIALNFVKHSVIPLYPKSEWFGRAFGFRWNMLNPFNGGSGPLGFYVSFLFIALSFLSSTIFGVIGLFKKEWRSISAVIILVIGLVYNAVMIEEVLLGRINGSAPDIMRQAVSFVHSSPDIKGVLTYNDIGAYELLKIEKYAGRFYAAPQFEDEHKIRFMEHVASGGGYFMVVDIPHINKKSFYGEFFQEFCQSVFSAKDRQMLANVYHCKHNINE